MFEYETIQVKFLPFEGYGKVEIYFSNTENFSLISIPNWNFSFLWELKDDDTKLTDIENKNKLIKALSVPMFERDATKLSDVISQYLWNCKWEI